MIYYILSAYTLGKKITMVIALSNWFGYIARHVQTNCKVQSKVQVHPKLIVTRGYQIILYKISCINRVPKILLLFLAAGCTTVKSLLEFLAGVIPNGTISNDMYKWRGNVHGPWERKLSLLSLNQNVTELILSSYYKFMILRDPVERILSAYKSKVGETLQLPLNRALYDFQSS